MRDDLLLWHVVVAHFLEPLLHPGDVLMDVETVFSPIAPALCEGGAVGIVFEDVAERLREGCVVTWFDQQAGLSVFDDFGDAGNVRADAGASGGHRFEQNGRQGIDVAVLGVHAWQRETARLLHELADAVLT